MLKQLGEPLLISHLHIQRGCAYKGEREMPSFTSCPLDGASTLGCMLLAVCCIHKRTTSSAIQKGWHSVLKRLLSTVLGNVAFSISPVQVSQEMLQVQGCALDAESVKKFLEGHKLQSRSKT
jgi:hypothetical protein